MARLTLKQMADEMNEWFKAQDYAMQYTVLGRKVLHVDYSVLVHRKKYGRAPVVVSDFGANTLRWDYSQMKRGLLK